MLLIATSLRKRTGAEDVRLLLIIAASGLTFALSLLLLGWSTLATAHGVAEGDALFIEQAAGVQLMPFIYLGAKHMVTGYDHLLFLVGVIFFLYRMKDIGIYVTLFAVGHSVTLLYGVLSGAHVNPYIVDAIIGLSVVYKALDNLGAFRRWFGVQPNAKAAVLIFGFFHGLGLATKLQDFTLSEEGLIANILAFNVGVEVGQLVALGAILIAMNYWRRSASFVRQAYAANVLLMTAGFMLMGYQITGYLTIS
ncbi:HupE/UreJ family protein [Hahella ganghwensis]|uniref:HupE/UreJ family protein n=1 Tax=Hahella ganghwensis TaxID=286420 RepID=UPI00036B7114|nr:HupE/UreJ family protein [Hahella ganghwensis]